MINFIHLEGENIEIKGVKKIISSMECEAVVDVGEESVVLSGEKLEVKTLNLDEERVVFAGKVNNVKIGKLNVKKVPFYKKLFK